MLELSGTANVSQSIYRRTWKMFCSKIDKSILSGCRLGSAIAIKVEPRRILLRTFWSDWK